VVVERLRVGHPKKRLLFSVVQPADDRLRSDVGHCVAALVKSRTWSLARPRFIHEIIWPRCESHGDLPIETLGGDVDVYSALPPNLDRRQLDDVTAIFSAIGTFSRSKAVTFQVELGDAIIGMVSAGEMDRQLSEESLGAWTRRLQQSG
jgi:hypothetical protein